MKRYLLIITSRDELEPSKPERELFDSPGEAWDYVVANGYDVYTDQESLDQFIEEFFLPGEDGQYDLLLIDLENPTT